MLDHCSSIDARERLQHLRSIKIIAEELNCPEEEVAPLYEDVLMQLVTHAAIRDYLAILTAKRVKHLFIHHCHGDLAH